MCAHDVRCLSLLTVLQRYYGESIPFGKEVFSHPKSGLLQWLTSEQALADYSVVMRYVKKQLNMENAKVVAFGG